MLSKLCFSSGNMIVQYHLSVFICFDFHAIRVISRISLTTTTTTRLFNYLYENIIRRMIIIIVIDYLGIHVDDLAISFVLEQQPIGIGGEYLEVGGGIGCRCLGFPVIETQIGGFRHQSFLGNQSN